MKVKYIEFPEKGKVEVKTEEISTDKLQSMEVIVENEATLCSAGTELAGLHDTESKATYPMRPGYAAIGRIKMKGEGVDDFEVGERVFYAGNHASAERFLHGQDHQWGRLYKVPEGIASEDATFVCLAEIAMVSSLITPVNVGDRVAVLGLGQVGNLAGQFYRNMGCHVIGVDPVRHRCDLALECGYDEVVDVAPDKQVEALKELTGGEGVDVSVEATGLSQVAITAAQATRLMGQIALLGSPRAPYETNISAFLRQVHLQGQVVRGAHMWRFPAMDSLRSQKTTIPWAYKTIFELMLEGKLIYQPLKSHVLSPDKAPEVYDGLKNKPEEYIGVVFDWTE
ncbi:MAG: zinc-binding dehydrogenase [Candidatus Sumerlaeota bacterium]